jgi:multidrug efflux pump subunit AcrB
MIFRKIGLCILILKTAMLSPDSNKNRLSSFKVLLVFLCVILVGMFLLPKLPVKLAPQRDMPSLTVSFSMNNMSSRVVEMEVTSKLEGMLGRIKGIQRVSSSSDNGNGFITVQLNKHAKVNVVRFEIASMIRQVYPSLPEGVSYPMVSARQSDENSASTFLTYTLNAPSSPIQIQQYAENNIKHVLANLKGVDQVDINGASGKVWLLEYDYRQLKTLGLSVGDLGSSIQNYLDKTFLGMGQVESGKAGSSDAERSWIRLILAPQRGNDVFDISGILVKNQEGKLIRLDEVVKVTYEEAKPYNYYRINGLNSVYLLVSAKGEANQLRLAKAIKQKLLELEKHFPPNYEIHLAYDATEYIVDQLKILLFRSCLTILILLIFIMLIYRNTRYVLMIVCSLLGSLGFAVSLYYALGLEMHLYSLMGITISLNLMLDNIIVMADQIHRQKNRQAFLAILASTMTTVAALAMIFFMEEKIKLNLQDFAVVIMINLASSLLVVLFLVPALMERLSIGKNAHSLKPRVRRRRYRARRRTVRCSRIYASYVRFSARKWGLVLLVVLLLFGLPVFLLPSSIKKETLNRLERGYNATLGSTLYQDKIKPIADVALGGTLRLFVQKVYEGSYWKNNEETSIYVSLTMPNGATLDQTDFLIGKMESYLQRFSQIKQFQTNVSTQRASIDIRFLNEYQFGSFPYSLKNELISKAVELGGGSWGVYGMGDGFSNNLAENAGSSRLKLMGYNYDELYSWAECVRDSLLQYRRIKDVTIDSRFSYFKDDYQEFIFGLKKGSLAEEDISPQSLFSDLSPLFQTDRSVAEWVTHTGVEPIRLTSGQTENYDIWMLNQDQGKLGDRAYRISNLAKIDRYQAPKSIARENQQYTLCLQYEYIGSSEQANMVLDKVVEKYTNLLPVGYRIEKEGYQGWNDKGQAKQYWLLLIIICIIYFTTSILFNSLRQPLAILLLIPVSFVGLFLTFYFFKLNFDQGGFAAFVLLSGITVNAGIYVVNQYNQVRRRCYLIPEKAYLKALNYRIVPVSLTILTTILGFTPFLIGEREGFWFPLAAGTIGGLVFSILGLVFFLPAFLGLGSRRKESVVIRTGWLRLGRVRQLFWPDTSRKRYR